MPNPFRDMGVSDSELERDISNSAEVKAEKRKTAKAMVEYAQSIAPKNTGEYASKIEVVTKNGEVKVGALAWYSHFIEYGTGPDTKEGSPFGPDTETPEFAVMARTAAQFGGTSDGESGEGR